MKAWVAGLAVLAAVPVLLASNGCDDAYRIDVPPAWESWSDQFDTQGFNNAVYCLAEHNGALYAGGVFTRAGDATVNCVARWDDGTWSALANGVRRHDCTTEYCAADVRALCSWQGLLVAAGRFTIAGGEPSLSIAAWDGTAWHAFEAGLHGNVEAVVSYRGDLIAGGDFTTTGAGDSVSSLAKWDGSRWVAFAGGVVGRVRALGAADDDLFVAGEFTRAEDGVDRLESYAHWNAHEWVLDSNPGTVNGLWPAAGTVLATGGLWWKRPESDLPVSMARWNGDSWVGISGWIGSVDAGCQVADRYFTMRWVDSGSYALFRHHGSQWERISPAVFGRIQTMIAFNGRVFIGGSFLNAGDTPSRFIARWDVP
jgi:hypothetical protein